MKHNHRLKFSLKAGKLWLMAILALVFSFVNENTHAQTCDLVVNGTFAAPHACPETGFTYDYQCDPTPSINGEGYLAVTNNAYTWNGPWWGLNRSGDGTNFLIADGANSGGTRIWIQQVNVVAGRQYTFTAWARNLVNPGSGAGTDQALPTVSIRLNNTVLATSSKLAQTAPTSWTQISATYTATTTGAVTLDVLQNIVNNSYNDVGVDDISFTYTLNNPSATAVSVCSGSSATLTASGGSASDTYLWYTSSSSTTPVFTGNPFVTPAVNAPTTYWVALRTSTGCISGKTAVTVNLLPVPRKPITIGETICQGSTATIRAVGIGGANAVAWYTSATGGSPVFHGNPFVTPALNITTTYWAVSINNNGCESERVPTTVTVNPSPAAPSVNPVTICAGSSAQVTASGASSGSVYIWYSSATASTILSTGSTFNTPVLTSTTTYWVAVRNPQTGCESIRTSVVVTVNPTPAAPVVTDQSVCRGSSATLTASGAAAGSTYVWYTSPFSTNSIFTGNPFVTPVLNNPTTYWVSIRSSSGCESSRVRIHIRIEPLPNAPFVNGATICGPASATLHAIGGAGGFVWYASATGGTPLFTGNPFVTPVLNTTTSYWVSAKNNVGCESIRRQVTVTVNPSPSDPVVTGAARCGCGTLQLSATGSNGTYNWYDNANATTALASGTSFTTPSICATATYWVSVTGANGCKSNAVPVQATIMQSNTNLVVNGNFAAPNSCPQSGFTYDYQCDPTSPINGSGSLAVTNNAYTWNGPWWGLNRTADGTNFLIADGASSGNTRIWIQQVNVVAGQQYTFTAWARNLVNPGSGAGVDNNPPVISLRVDNAVIATSPAIVQTAPTVWTQISGTYTATTTGNVTLNVFQNIVNGYNDVGVDDISFSLFIPSPTVTDRTICTGNLVALTAQGAPSGGSYEWYDDATAGNLLSTSNPFLTPVLSASTTYWVAIKTSNGCLSERVPVHVTVNPLPSSPVTQDVSICENNSVSLTATGNGQLLWYAAAAAPVPFFTGNPFVTPVLTATTTYWVAVQDANGCISARVPVQVTVNPKPAAPTTTNGKRCDCGTVQLSANGTAGTFNWYSSATDQTILGTGTSFTTPSICNTTAYWVSITDANGCVSDRSIATATVVQSSINLVVNGNFAAPNACPQTGFTYDYQCDPTPTINGPGNLAVTNNAYTWNGPWWGLNRTADGTNFLIADGANTGSTRIWIQQVNVVAGQQYTFTAWARNLVNPGSGAGIDNNPPTVSLRVNNTVLVTSPALVQTAPTVWTQISAVYTATTTGSISIDVFQNLSNGYDDVGIDDISFTTTLTTPTVNNVTTCANTTATLTASGAPANAVYNWYDAATGDHLVYTGNPFVTPVLTATTSYWVSITDANTCESDRVQATVTINGAPVIASVTDASRCDCGTLTLSATGDAGTYNWYDAQTGGTLVGTGTSFTTPSICSTTNYFVSVTNANGCTSFVKQVTASITGPAVTIAGPTQVYANAIVQYTLTIANNSGADMNGIIINPSLAGFVIDPTFTPNPSPAGPYNIMAGGAPINVTFVGYFPTAGVPQTICFDVIANGCTTNVCKNITNVYAGCPFSYSAVTSDCDTENYGPNGVIKTVSLSGHANFFDITSIDFNLTYNPVYVSLVAANIVSGSPAGTLVNTTSTNNPDGTITVNGTVVYGSKVDILTSNGDGDIVVNKVVNLDFRIISRPANTCDLQLPTTGTTFHTATTIVSRPTDLARFVFLCTPCPAVSAFFTASPNPVMQGATVTFTADPSAGAHTWYSGEFNDRQLGNTSPVASYVYKTPGTYTVTHYRTENGQTGIYSQQVTVCGITTNALTTTSACAGSTINVSFTASDCSGFQANNVFSVQLSDATGVFSMNSPIIGTLSGTTGGQIAAVIPAGTVAGNQYRVRVISSNPSLMGTDNGQDLVITSCNSGLTFDGINDRVTIPHHNAYNVGSGNFTLEALVNLPASTGFENPIFSKRTSGFDGFLLYCYGTQLLLQMNGVPNYQSNAFANINDGKCHHIAITRSGTAVTFYVDGTVVGGAVSSRGLNSAGPLYIGYDAVDNSFLNGSVNEVRFWNIARSSAQITQSASASVDPSSAGLIGLWRFNETGQTVADASVTNNAGVLGTNNAVEDSDPSRTTLNCYSGDRHDAASIDAVYNSEAAWTVTAVPNPFTDETLVSISGMSGASSCHVDVYSMQGMLILTKDISANGSLALGDTLTPGMYFVKVSANGISQMVKIVKE